MSIEAMKQALEALEIAEKATRKLEMFGARIGLSDADMKMDKATVFAPAITSLRQAIAEAEKQEPVAWDSLLGAVARGWCYEENANKTMDTELALAIAKEVSALYTHSQPKREWVGLTDEEMHDCWDSPLTPLGMKHARMIEAKLKEKNYQKGDTD